MRQKMTLTVLASLALVLWAASEGLAQSGISALSRTLPSERLGTGWGGYTTSSQFTGRGGGAAPSGLLAVRFDVSPARVGAYRPSRFDFSKLRSDLAGLRLRTIESYALRKRARFSRLQRFSLELAEQLGREAGPEAVDVRQSFFQFVFPFGLRDKPQTVGYGYFCVGCLNRGLIEDPDQFLSEFSEETQEAIPDENFMNTLVAMFRDGKPPEGLPLDGFYDSQLAAMGNYLFGHGRYGPAAEVWALLAKRDPASSVYAQATGQSLFANHQFDQASADLRRSLRLAPGWGTDAFRIRGANLQNIYRDPGRLAEARMNLEAQLKKSPDDAALSFLMGYIDLFHGLWDRAATRLESLGAGGDEEARILAAALKDGRVDRSVARPFASSDVLTAEDVAEMSTDVLLTPEERRAAVEAMLEPRTAEDYMNRGDFFFFMGNYAEASRAFTTAAQMDPENSIVKFAEVHAAFANAEFDYAALKLREALAAEPNWGLFNFRLEEFFGNRKDMDKRVRDLQHLLKIEPDDTGAKMLLGYVYYFDGRYGEAAKMLGEVITASPAYQVTDHLLKLAQLQS